MCYSFESSVFAFLIAMTTVFFMYLRKTKLDKLLGPIVLTYGFMQFAEALMWYDQECGKINKIATYFAYYILVLQLLATGIGIYLTEKNPIGIFIGIIVLIYFYVTMPKMKCSKPYGNVPHMIWGFKYYRTGFIWPLILIFILFLSKIKKIYKFIIFFWMSSTYLYFYSKQVDINHWFKLYYDISNTAIGTKWCHFASLSTPGLYFIQNLKY